MNRLDDRDHRRRHLGGDGHGSALGDLVVKLAVEHLLADIEGGFI